MTDLLKLAERCESERRHEVRQLRLPIYPIPHLAGHPPARSASDA